jgi:cytochrome c553
MKKSMSKRWMGLGLVVVLAIGLVVAAPRAYAKGAPNVKNTVHNLSKNNGSNQYRTNSEEVCVFCHTPHGGTVGLPLWNREDPSSAWQFYDSPTLTAAAKDPARPVNAESLMCLSCHDGSVATNRVINPPNELGGAQPVNFVSGSDEPIQGWLPGSFSRTGGVTIEVMPGVYGSDDSTGNLTDDHPISFSYYDAQQDDAELHLSGDVLAMGPEAPRFFGTVAAQPGGMMIECSTCHDPHVDYNADPDYSPFLIMPNANSALCLACHIK